MRAALAFLSVVILALHGIVFYSQFFARWQEHQQKYFDEAAAQSESPAVKAALLARKPAIEQSLVRSFGQERVDRCATCHIAVEDPRFAKADQPLEILRTIHSFDPCLACSTHVMSPDGQELAQVTVQPM